MRHSHLRATQVTRRAFFQIGRRLLLGITLGLTLVAFASLADALAPTARTEIDHLLSYLEHSGCRFYRNGIWYDAPAARAHLQRKYDYLIKKGLLGSTEDFISKAASSSSTSGENYLVECKKGQATPSAHWLADELTRYRRAERPTK